jgi:2C-methyl-D-erythritol 2,4-cyclodiphosphate synthase
MQQAGAFLNTEATVVAEAQRLAPYVRRCGTAGEVMGMSVARLGQSQENEGMDAVGRREGIAAMAVATVCRASATHLSGDQ